MVKLGVNIDHVATLRQARKTIEPDPIGAAVIVERAGANGVTVHLREDRRHINERDVALLRRTIRTRLNLEMSVADEIVAIALDIRPDQATLVPEKRQEVTTEGGLDIIRHKAKIKKVVTKLRKKKIIVSLFIEPDIKQIKAAKETGADFIELHTGRFANAKTGEEEKRELEILSQAAEYAGECGLRVNAGHGLNYENTKVLLKKVKGIEELNIGHSIISHSVFVGLSQAVKEMKNIIMTYSMK